MTNLEKPGYFYLGKLVNPSNRKGEEGQPLLYQSKNLTTHAVCLGMTGSGKTGLGITILEEAGLNKIPAIIVDPKGDLGNLLLTFPNLSADEFLPWIDKAEASNEGLEPKAYAEEIAKKWKEGLASSGETPERIQKLKESVEMVIYTPASNAGVPLSILSSFKAPTKDQLLDTGAVRDRVLIVASSLLGLLGINADPIKSREHILISTIISSAWQEGNDLDITTLIEQVQRPPFNKIGALDVDTFFPLKDRNALSISLNNLLASPGFQAWMEGEPLDIQELLYTKEGKPKLSILSIAHLSDTERMFFVTLLLNEIVSWIRRQPGTSSLKALFYMDEIFGYFPPTAMPPSKMPMLTLLKQARAYGLGVVLATQNPVDLDYKGLANCGTWFIGKLQTERDKARVCEGLRTASNGEIDAEDLNRMLSSISTRTFIMRSIYEKEPVLFKTRWTLSYLCGPLTLTQIQGLKKSFPEGSEKAKAAAIIQKKGAPSTRKPMVPAEISEFFINMQTPTKKGVYKGQLLGKAKLHFVDTKNKIDVWHEVSILAPTDANGNNVLWEEGKNWPDLQDQLEKTALPETPFEELPSGLMQIKNYLAFEKTFKAFLYQNQTLPLFKNEELSLISNIDESEEAFRSRIGPMIKQKRDQTVEKLRETYAEKINAITRKLTIEKEKLSQQQHKVGWKRLEALISIGTTVLNAVLGKRVTKGTITQAGTSIKRAGQSIGSPGTTQIEDECNLYQKQLEDLQTQLQNEIAAVEASSIAIEKIEVNPRKSDISIEPIALVWVLI